MPQTSFVKSGLIAVSLLLPVTVAQASIEYITVTGTRTPHSQVDAPVLTQVISRSQIARLQGASIVPLLRQVAGADVVTTGSLGGQTSVFLQGANSGHTLILLDGQPLTNAATGSAALEHLHPDDIERIEIVRGARSSLYGSGGMAGIIQIFTREGLGQGNSIRVRHGAHNYRELAANGSYRGDFSRHQFNFSRRLYSGYDQTLDKEFGNASDDSYYATNLMSNNHVEITDWLEVSFRHSQSSSLTEYDSQCFDPVDFHRVECHPARKVDQKTDRLTVAMEFTDRLSHKWQAGRTKDISSLTDRSDPPMVWSGIDQGVEVRSQDISWQQDWTLAGGNHKFSLGADWVKDEVSGYDSTSAAFDRRTAGVFTQYQVDYVDWQVASGVRWQNDSVSGHEFTHHVNLTYRLHRKLRLGAGHSTGFKAPSMNDLFWPDSGNPDLNPERSERLQGFVQYLTGFGVVELELFDNHFDNLISWQPDADGFTWRPRNIDSARTRGMTFRFEHEWDLWRIRAHITWQNTKDNETNDRLLYRAHNHGVFTVSRGFSEGVLSWDIVSSGRRHAEGEQDINPVITANARWEQSLLDKWMLYVSMDNFFDREYQQRPGFVEPRRQFRLGVSYHWR